MHVYCVKDGLGYLFLIQEKQNTIGFQQWTLLMAVYSFSLSIDCYITDYNEALVVIVAKWHTRNGSNVGAG